MDTASFDYSLPTAEIAQTPIEPWDSARLLVDRGADRVPEHRTVSELDEILSPGDLLVVNDTRVIPARLRLTKPTGGAVEVLLLEPRPDGTWEALVKPGRRVAPGTVLHPAGLATPEGAPPAMSVEVGAAIDGDGRRTVRLHPAGDDLALLAHYGEVPLPPYIRRPLADPDRYQTVFAEHPGSVAAPTAGLHLTEAVLERCRARGVAVAAVELAVGLGTFRPIATPRVEDHRMHAERYRVPAATVEAVARAERVVAVGTTVVRALESWGASGAREASTDLFIQGPDQLRVVDRLLTNFHMPRSSLLVLVAAFVGPRWRDLYAAALADGYRFCSFGDAMLIDRDRSVRLTVDVTATAGAARSGRVVTARGALPLPLFMPVGTRGAVKTLASSDLEALGVPLILGNTYHLMLRPGADLIAKLGGLHEFMAWPGHVLTDSGGYQVFSLSPQVTDDGATFRSTYDGSTHHLTPEGAVAVQAALGADIQMVLDVCPPLPSPPAALRTAVERTAQWAARGRRAFVDGAEPRLARGLHQSQFGIVQGGTDEKLRAESARRTVEVGFDGYAIGGLSVGESRDEMLPALAAALEHLPADQPRYLMGVGDPAGIVEAIGLGVDMFDCVLPTRHARHGTILSSEGRFLLKSSRFEADDRPLDPTCSCPVCARWSRAYLRHLFRVGEPAAARLLTIHNLAWTLALVADLTEAIEAGTFAARRAELLAVWGDGGHGASGGE